jgi:YD repeat-containing protein
MACFLEFLSLVSSLIIFTIYIFLLNLILTIGKKALSGVLNMKNLLLLPALLICLPTVICSQTHNEKIIAPFLMAHKHSPQLQFLGKQPLGKKIQSIQQSRSLKKIKNNKKLRSGIYRPIKVTCDDTLQYTYTYDNSGNMLTELNETWSNNVWIIYSKHTYTYDNSGNILTGLEEIWSNNVWVNSSRFTFAYDNSGNFLTGLWELWSNNVWVNSYRYTYTYNNFRNMLTELEETWSDNAWVNYNRSTNTYDNSGNWLTELVETWSNNAWVNSFNYTSTYDNSGNMLTELDETWLNNAWVIEDRETCTYDNSGNCLTGLDETWSDSVWVNYYKDTYTYDNFGNLLTGLDESWLNSAWVNNYKWIDTYDNSSNLLTELDETWSNSAWVNNYKYAFTFDNNGNCIHGESLIWQDSAWVKYYSSFPLYYNNSQNNLSFSAAVVDAEYASITSVASDQLNTLSFNLQQNYPNPFNPTTTINYSLAKEGHVKLTVYNAIGSQVAAIVDEYKPAGNYSIQFNGSNLASGIYLYRLETGNYNAAKKLILLK